jgi:hypothetical protein
MSAHDTRRERDAVLCGQRSQAEAAVVLVRRRHDRERVAGRAIVDPERRSVRDR